MAETLRAERSDYVLLLDDDVVAEPEGILRAVTFADLARTPDDRRRAHVRPVRPLRAARLRRERSRVPLVDGARRPHTGTGPRLRPSASLRDTPWLHRRVDVDFNGWWMCLIPVDVLRKLGLSLPVFIKWDDIEYGVRARAAGIPTVSAARRRRLARAVARQGQRRSTGRRTSRSATASSRALLHSPYDRGGNMLKESLIMVTKHALAMQYSTAELMLLGIEDVLKGPDDLHGSITTKMAELRRLRAGFPDAQAKPDVEDFPRARRPQAAAARAASRPRPATARTMVKAALSGLVRQMRPVEPVPGHPEVTVPHVDQSWWLLSRFDSALVSAGRRHQGRRGTSATRQRLRSILQRNAVLHAAPAARMVRAEAGVPRGAARSSPHRSAGVRRSRPPGRRNDDRRQPLVAPGRGGGLLEVARRRYLLRLLVRRELRSRYQGSLLGLGWSYVRPAVSFAVYFFVVGVFLKMSKAIPGYPVFLFSGMVVISFFTETLITSTWSVIGNAPLVQKIYLPREMFPVASAAGLRRAHAARPDHPVGRRARRRAGRPRCSRSARSRSAFAVVAVLANGLRAAVLRASTCSSATSARSSTSSTSSSRGRRR